MLLIPGRQLQLPRVDVKSKTSRNMKNDFFLDCVNMLCLTF